MQNVSTRRRDRINSDEEERLRLGYELRTGVRFADPPGPPLVRTAEHAQRRRADRARSPTATPPRSGGSTSGAGGASKRNRLGFVLDIERGYWGKDDDEQTDDDDVHDDGTPRTERVIPFVEDGRNCLLLEPTRQLDRPTMASLQAALKHAIQAGSSSRTTSSPPSRCPTRDDRRTLLFYESAEGGAGVLRRLVDEPDALAAVAATALELCHFDPDTGDDDPDATAPASTCEAACYDCLMSYRTSPTTSCSTGSARTCRCSRTGATPRRDRRARRPTPEPSTSSDSRPVGRLATSNDDWLDVPRRRRLPPADAGQVLDRGRRHAARLPLRRRQSAGSTSTARRTTTPTASSATPTSPAGCDDLGWTVIRFGHDDDWAADRSTPTSGCSGRARVSFAVGRSSAPAGREWVVLPGHRRRPRRGPPARRHRRRGHRHPHRPRDRSSRRTFDLPDPDPARRLPLGPPAARRAAPRLPLERRARSARSAHSPSSRGRTSSCRCSWRSSSTRCACSSPTTSASARRSRRR